MINWLREAHEKAAPLFEKGGKLEFFYPIYEAQFTGLFTPGTVTRTGSHVRDGMDLKRMMIWVVDALVRIGDAIAIRIEVYIVWNAIQVWIITLICIRLMRWLSFSTQLLMTRKNLMREPRKT